jgi:zinc transporter ZupT
VIPFSFTSLVLFAFAALAASYAGVAISGVPGLSRKMVPFSGALLLLVSLVWVLPEMAEDLGWAPAFALMLAGFTVLWVIDKHVYPVCPSCSHTHDHDTCDTRLHGFAGPLLAAAVVHSMFDGWALAGAHAEGQQGIWAGVLVHKLPESLAFGMILRAAMKSRWNAIVSATLVQAATIAGAALEMSLAPYIGPYWLHALLAMTGGTFLYLGFHAVHGEWKRRVEASIGVSRHS